MSPDSPKRLTPSGTIRCPHTEPNSDNVAGWPSSTGQNAGTIRKFVTLLDPVAVNLAVTVFVQISLDLQVDKRLEIFNNAIMKRPEIVECYLMTGDADYLLRVVVPDVAAYERFLRESLTRIEVVASIKSSRFGTDKIFYGLASAAGPVGVDQSKEINPA